MSSEPPFTEAWRAGPQSTQFYTRTYTAPSPKAALVFVHGFIEHIGRHTHIHSKLSEHGITVFAFDLRGFGKTATDPEKKSKTSAYGKTSWKHQLEDIQWAVEHVRQELPEVPIFLMGHSMVGILISLSYFQFLTCLPHREEVKRLDSRLKEKKRRSIP